MNFPQRTADASEWKVLDLTVDLAKEYDAALFHGLPFLKIFADVVVVPEDFAKSIGGYTWESAGYMQNIQVIARRMEVAGGRGKLRINPPAERDVMSAVSLLVGEIVGNLEVQKINFDAADEPSVGDRANAAATGEKEDLRYVRYSSKTKDGQLLTEPRPIELALLQPGGPLHQLFSASYAHAASLAGAFPSNPESWALARQIFDWLARWTKYPPSTGEIGQSEIAFFAERLTRVLPSLLSGDSPVYAVPPRRSHIYLGDCKTKFELARQIEAKLDAAIQKRDLKQTFGQFVTTLSGRDKEDLQELGILIIAATRRVEAANAAVEEAAEKIKELQLDIQVDEIELKTKKATEAIKNTLMAVWNVVYGLYQVVTGVGSGILAAQAAGAVKAIGQIPTQMQFFLGVVGASDDKLKDKAFQLVYTLGYLPYSEMSQAWNSIDEKARDKLIGGITSGVPSLIAGAGKLNSLYLKDRPEEKDLAAIAALVSDATRAFDAAKAKAAWESFQVDFEKKLDPMIEANSGDVSDAARGLRATLKKLVIAGKLFSEQQATLAMANRELGTGVLRRTTIKKSRALFDKLAGELGTDEERSELLIREANARLVEWKQSFFATTWEYKTARFYEYATWPKQQAKIPGDATDFGLICQALDQESQSTIGRGDIVTVRIAIDDRDVLNKFRETGEAPFVIDFRQKDLAGFQTIRLEEMAPVIEGVKSKTPGDGYTISLTSAANYWDQVDGGAGFLQWQGRPCSVSFSFNADGTVKSRPSVFFPEAMPSPFTEWIVKVEKAADLDLTGVSKLSLDIKANAVRRKS